MSLEYAAAGAAPETTADDMIRCESLTKAFRSLDGKGETLALVDFTLSVRRNEFITILGPSGCGKSTLLYMVAGFEGPTRGRLLVDGQPVTGPSPERGMVFQEYALFPWLRIRDNIAYGLRQRGVPKARRREVVAELLELIGLSSFADYYPNQLSGGMKQRVALARVLANDPKLLLLDEPFGALDELRRTALQDELLRIWEAHRKTALFITHSIEEAIVLGDRIVVMSAHPGRITTIVAVPLARPRDRSSDEFNAIRRVVTQALTEGAAASGTPPAPDD
jgi:ABC-type nitrate/sulfonate/bicarbonate transport system ATPase subunit